MREIKFRFYDKDNSQMYYQTEDFKDLALINGQFKPVLNNLIKNSFNWYRRNYELMQYTGLKDKNGQEIYEGDIVEVIFDGKLRIFQVVFDLSELDFKATNGTEHYGNNFEYLTCCDEVRIIGNIYQDGDILNDNKNTKTN